MDTDRKNTTDMNRTAQETASLNAELDALLAGSPVNMAKGTGKGSKAESEEPSVGGKPEKHMGEKAQQSNRETEGVKVLSQRAVNEKAGKRRRQYRGLRILAGILCVLVVVAGLGVGALWYLKEQGRKALLVERPQTDITGPEGAEVSPDGSYVTWQGKRYKRNENIVSILVMGVDRKEEEIARADELQVGEQGQADTILVGALDTETGSLKIINISRDSMTDVDIYNVNGEYAGVEEMQICLAYAYGDGAHLSCENVSKSVTRLLYGLPMDIYASVELPAVSVLNDAVGGVTLDVLEDLSSRDPALTKGALVTLNGDQARIYVQSRNHENLDANNARMARQKQYLVAFLSTIQKRVRQNISTIFTLYQAVQTYLTTNIDLSKITYLASLAFSREITADAIRTVPGEVTKGEEYAEYHVDEEALYQIILDTYYTQTNENPATGLDGQAGTEEDVTDSNSNPADQQAGTGKDDTQATFQQAWQSQAETEQMITIDPAILH